MQLFYEFVILFFIFAVLGWMMEVTLKYIQYHRFINRGFLIGPYCPIYGAGVVGVTVLVGGLIGREGTYGETFLAGFVICGFLEYMTSLYMEKMFHARWWDYSDKPMNLHGRIWIGNLILFGLASLVIVKFIDPHYFAFIEGMNVKLLTVLSWSIIILMAFDYGLSHFLMNIVKKEIDLTNGDDTEEISLKVHELLKDRSVLIRRIYEAYPDFKVLPAKLKDDYNKAKAEYKAAKKSLDKRLKARFEKEFDLKQYKEAKRDLEEKYERFKSLSKRFKGRF